MVNGPRFRVDVDVDRCVGSGNCVFREPAVFDQNEDDAVVFLLEQHPELRLLNSVTEAARQCPAQAIRVTLIEEGSAVPGST